MATVQKPKLSGPAASPPPPPPAPKPEPPPPPLSPQIDSVASVPDTGPSPSDIQQTPTDDKAPAPDNPPIAQHQGQHSRAQNQSTNCCQACCTSIMKVFAHDAIYGSFVGPHPVSFLCCCCCCHGCCNRKCYRPFCVASIATKVMYFIMLAFITILACMFIIPWPVTDASTGSTYISSFYPCDNYKMIKYFHLNGGCEYHAGYFMVYRCFFAFGTLMLMLSALMLFVTSSKEDPHRAKIHQGFWFYKYLILVALLTLYFLFLNGSSDREGVFEFFCSVVGNIAHMLFSFIELTFIMDILEMWVIENERREAHWAACLYWTFTGLIFLCSFIMLCYVGVEFSMKREFPGGRGYFPLDNCVPGKKVEVDPEHAGIISGIFFLVVISIIIMFFKNKFERRFPYTGWLQVAMLTLWNFSFMWSALYSSPNVHSRPRCNWAIPYNYVHYNRSIPVQDLKTIIQPGSLDIYFRVSGFYHGIMAVLTLLYFCFIHGPRASTAPLSAAYDFLFTTKARIPVFPHDSGAPAEFQEAIKAFKVWDDEQDEVAYSWSLFYAMMAFGGLSLMMAMTNFTNPWAVDKYNSSYVALGCKLGTAVCVTLTYITLLIKASTKVHPDDDKPKLRRKKKRKSITAGEVELEGSASASDVEEDEYEYVDEGPGSKKASIEITEVPLSSRHHRPKDCGCLM